MTTKPRGVASGKVKGTGPKRPTCDSCDIVSYCRRVRDGEQVRDGCGFHSTIMEAVGPHEPGAQP